MRIDTPCGLNCCALPAAIWIINLITRTGPTMMPEMCRDIVKCRFFWHRTDLTCRMADDKCLPSGRGPFVENVTTVFSTHSKDQIRLLHQFVAQLLGTVITRLPWCCNLVSHGRVNRLANKRMGSRRSKCKALGTNCLSNNICICRSADIRSADKKNAEALAAKAKKAGFSVIIK